VNNWTNYKVQPDVRYQMHSHFSGSNPLELRCFAKEEVCFGKALLPSIICYPKTKLIANLSYYNNNNYNNNAPKSNTTWQLQ